MSGTKRRFVAYGFASVHDALAAEAALKGAGLEVVAIPSPRELGGLCGVALRIEPDLAAAAEDVLAGSGLDPRAIAEIDDL